MKTTMQLTDGRYVSHNSSPEEFDRLRKEAKENNNTIKVYSEYFMMGQKYTQDIWITPDLVGSFWSNT